MAPWCAALADVHYTSAQAVGPSREEARLVGAGQRMAAGKAIAQACSDGLRQYRRLDAADVGEEGTRIEHGSQTSNQIERRPGRNREHHQLDAFDGSSRCVGQLVDGRRLERLNPFGSFGRKADYPGYPGQPRLPRERAPDGPEADHGQ
jgi:hypothetical protein